MSGPWWPEGAPYPAMPCGQYTSTELRNLLRWGAGAALAADSSGDTARCRLLAGWLAPLLAESDERRELNARITVSAQTGKRTLL